ncbi:MAG: hypothetical protein CSA62_09645 [Planctomycetota bacterium]|nr:MAG: hypothetical protein CSA62_09645 [Planctomycetota bacterium]
MRTALVLLLLFAFPSLLFAKNFRDVSSDLFAKSPSRGGGATWIDLNGDTYPDLIVNGRIYRLEKKYASEGIDLNRSVLQRSTKKFSEIFTSIYDQLRKEVLASDVLFSDDQPITIASASSGNRRTGRTWVY